jgi:hypothetical protein
MSDLSLPQEGPEPTSSSDRWRGYADYRTVSIRVAQSIDSALDAYARIHGAHAEGASIEPELAAEARGRIMSAALKLIPELQQDRDSVEQYDTILERWEGDDGFVSRFAQLSLQDQCPGWMHQFVIDIRTAGWELGYLQAGKREAGEPDNHVDAEATSMFRE